MQATEYDPAEVIGHSDPVWLGYQEWVNVVMALKDAGYPVTACIIAQLPRNQGRGPSCSIPLIRKRLP